MSVAQWWPGPVPAEPDFANLVSVLQCSRPSRPTLFEFFLNEPIYRILAGAEAEAWVDQRPNGWDALLIRAFRNAGYDYATIHAPFGFPKGEVESLQTRSLNDGALITDRPSFDAYPWPDADEADSGKFDALAPNIPGGMKLIVPGPGGVLENAIQLTGYDRLCLLLADDPPLVSDLFESIGSRLVRHYERALEHNAVGAIIGNDDWGFKTQTMLSPDDMRRYVFPWHRRIVETAHAAGRPAILHSCGNLATVMDDIIDEMGYDGKHSYEDAIQPVEEAYDQYGGRIAVLGGIDVDFVIRETPERVHARASEMLARADRNGGFALGTGNSVPEYIPDDNYLALIAAATTSRR